MDVQNVKNKEIHKQKAGHITKDQIFFLHLHFFYHILRNI